MFKYFAGAMLSNLFPARRLQVEQGFTMPYFVEHAGSGIISRLIRFHIGHRGRHDQQKLESLHKSFWKKQRPQDWFDATSERTHRLYIPTFRTLVEEIRHEIVSNQVSSVVEFGTGNGDWLAYLQSQWSGPKRFLGLDIADEQIKINRRRHLGLEFQACDLTDWVAENKSRQTLFVTNCGVLEYLSESTLQQVLRDIRINHLESMVLFVEPIAAGFDLDQEQHSQLQGTEYSFSHNYPMLLKQNGFEVLGVNKYQIENFQMVSTLAKSNQNLGIAFPILMLFTSVFLS